MDEIGLHKRVQLSIFAKFVTGMPTKFQLMQNRTMQIISRCLSATTRRMAKETQDRRRCRFL
ncbi:hypothetical protein GDI2822 [Gluconacetobacter diazotrophicus PA1 5]|uniref:Uncharacterized protein n=1 Tax=Gluconacetobacter diazotrophicus (strain ATCC 49037 / DSM 5601 / CCUG 37298 / CIP 103539 / LMG 7603 / PAl5) TaxID=272568 RepID=A9HQM5_GLUDA|nr:hypothetical protein GDI2822 [Gluconacetobacter diazotrophicus PA1 5]